MRGRHLGLLVLGLLILGFAPPHPTIRLAALPGAVAAWTWPVPGVPVVVRGFAPPPQPWLPGHRGVDLAGRAGLPVLSAGRGVIAFAGPLAVRGVVSILHPGGLRTTYEPVAASVRAGEAVGPGQVIGTLEAGHPGCAAPACLHWGLRRGQVYLDPLLLVRSRPVRLKPVAFSFAGFSSTGVRPMPAASWPGRRPAARNPRAGCRRGRRCAGTPARSSTRWRPRSAGRPRSADAGRPRSRSRPPVRAGPG